MFCMMLSSNFKHPCINFPFFFFLSVSGACTLFETWYQHISTRCQLSPSAGSFQGLLLCSAYKELIVTPLLIAVSWLNVLFFFKSWYLVSVKVPILQPPFIYCSLQSTTLSHWVLFYTIFVPCCRSRVLQLNEQEFLQKTPKINPWYRCQFSFHHCTEKPHTANKSRRRYLQYLITMTITVHLSAPHCPQEVRH